MATSFWDPRLPLGVLLDHLFVPAPRSLGQPLHSPLHPPSGAQGQTPGPLISVIFSQ